MDEKGVLVSVAILELEERGWGQIQLKKLMALSFGLKNHLSSQFDTVTHLKYSILNIS